MNQGIVVTGGARGIGLGIGRACAEAGARVMLVDRDEVDPGELGERVRAVRADITSREANERVIEEAVAAFGRVDGFVACAAGSRRGPFLEVSEADLEFTFGPTLYGTFWGLQAAARRMVAQGGGGSLLLVGSVHVLRHYQGASAYNVAKAGTWSLARTLAAELAPHRIRVNTVLPGWTDTPGELIFATREQLDAAGSGVPLGRLGRPEDIGRAARYLLSDEAEYVTGAELVVDGGFTLDRRVSG